MSDRNYDAAYEVDQKGRVVRDPVETIGAVPGEETPPDISGGPGEGTGWGAWRAEHETDANKAQKKAKAAKDGGQGKAKRDKERSE
jgi:hypothetical protein